MAYGSIFLSPFLTPPTISVLKSICFSVLLGDDPLQSLLYSVNCYKSTQEGCDTDLIDAYPKLSMSFTNNTVADTRFYLFTKNNPDVPELLHKCAGGLPPKTNFNPKCKTEILYPGGASGVCIFAIYRVSTKQLSTHTRISFTVLAVEIGPADSGPKSL